MSDLLNSASLVMIPSGYAEDKVYSVVPSDGSGDMAFTRASNGTRVNGAGLVEVTPWNLLQYSEDFTNGVWTTYQSSITSNSTTAPNGTNTADSLIDNTSNDQHLIQQGVATSAGTHTISVYAKSNTLSHSWIKYFDGTSAQESGIYNLSNATVSGSGSIESVGNGWCRLSLQVTTLANTGYFYILTSDGTNKFYAGTGKSIFIWGYQLNIGSTAKPYFPTTDRLNVPRLTYQNGGGGCPSLLLEKQSTNLFNYSEQFDQSSWTKQNSSVTANATNSPDGTTNADKFIASNANAFHAMYGLNSVLNGSHTISVYAKKGEYDFIVLHDQFSSTFNAVFNLNTGAVVSGSGASIQSIGNGWYRCIVTFNGGGNTVIASLSPSPTSSAGTNYQGDGTSGVFIWGAQLEDSSYPTSYIPTTSSSATRVADACFKTGISSLIGQTEGTLFAEFDFKSTANTGTYDSIINIATNANSSIDVLKNNTTSELYIFAINAGSIQVNSTGISGTNILGRHKVALAYKTNDYICYLDGVQVFTDTSATVPACSNLYLGAFLGSSNQLGGTISQAVLFKTRLTNAELASLTTI